MDSILNRESKKFGNVVKALKRHVYSINMRKNT
jgi:hypothetical protein